jgi:AcrR family transcriptional regulator
MSRRKLDLRIGPVLAGIATSVPDDDLATSVLDAAAELMREFGLRRWTMDDVADRAGLGRTTVYRTFSNRDELLHAVLARELRNTIAAINQAAATQESIEDKVVAGASAALRALSTSLVERLIQTDPDTFLPFLTVNAGPLVAIAREAIATLIRELDPTIPPTLAAEIGEAGARLGLSFVLVRDTIVALDDPDALQGLARRLLRAVAVLPANA